MKPSLLVLFVCFTILSNSFLFSQNNLPQNFQPTLLWEQGSSYSQPVYLSDNLVLTAGIYSASLIDLTSKKLIRNYIPPFSPIIYNIHLSKDKSKLLMCASQFVHIFDVATGNLLKSLENVAKNRYFTHAEFSPNASEFVVSRNEGSILVYNTTTLNLRDSTKQHSNRCAHVSFSNNGKYIASAGSAHAIPLYDANNLELVGTFPNGNGAIQCLTFSSNDSIIAAVGLSKRLWVYDVNTFQELLSLPISISLAYSLSLGNNDKMITVSGRNGDLFVYDLFTKQSKALKFNDRTSIASAFNSNSSKLVDVNPIGILHEIDLSIADTPKVMIPVTNSDVPEKSIRFSEDENYIVIASDYITKILDVNNGTYIKKSNNHIYSIIDFAISSDASKHFSGSESNITIFGSDSNYLLPTVGYATPIYSVDMCKKGEIGLTGDSMGFINKWDLINRQLKYRISNEFSVYDIKLSPDTKYFAVAIADKITKIFDTETGNLVFSFQSPNDPWLLQWSSDNQSIYMTDIAGKFYSISMTTQSGTELFDHGKRVICFRVHPNTKQVILVDNTEISQYDFVSNSKVSSFRIAAPNNSDYLIKSAEINSNCTKLALYNNYYNLMMFSIDNLVTSVSESDNFIVDITAYPNPSTQIVTISFANTLQNPNVSIIDNMGKNIEIKDFEFGNNQLSFDVSSLSNGGYSVNVRDGRNQYNSKFIIAR